MFWKSSEAFKDKTSCKQDDTLLKQTIEKSIYKDCGEGKVLIRLKIQS